MKRVGGPVIVLYVTVFASVGLAFGTPNRYSYDALNRLVKVERADGVAVTYTYDALGNRLSKTVIHDIDFDGVADSLDCAPTDPTAWGLPVPVTGVSVSGSGSSTITWDSQAATIGSGALYDVATGLLSDLHGAGGLGAATCLGSGLAVNAVADGRDPAAGDGFYYVVRSRNACGIGTYGASTLDTGAPCP